MNPQAQQALRAIHSLKRFDDYLRCARAELASDPANMQLGAFIDMIERLVAQEKSRLSSIGANTASNPSHTMTEAKSRNSQPSATC